MLLLKKEPPDLAWLDLPGGSDGKASAYNVRDPGSIPGSGRPSGEGNSNPLHYSCLENPVDGGAWWATTHGVAKSPTRLSSLTKLSPAWLFQLETGECSLATERTRGRRGRN